MTIFYADSEPLSKYSPVTFHLSPATRILDENPVVIWANPTPSLGKIRTVTSTCKKKTVIPTLKYTLQGKTLPINPKLYPCPSMKTKYMYKKMWLELQCKCLISQCFDLHCYEAKYVLHLPACHSLHACEIEILWLLLTYMYINKAKPSITLK